MEPKIDYGYAFTRHLEWLYNLRITHISEDFLLYSDDVSSAFSWPKLTPSIAATFSFLFFVTLYNPVGQVFGGNISVQNCESFAVARSSLSQHLFQHNLAQSINIRTDSPKENTYLWHNLIHISQR